MLTKTTTCLALLRPADKWHGTLGFQFALRPSVHQTINLMFFRPNPRQSISKLLSGYTSLYQPSNPIVIVSIFDALTDLT